MPIFHRETFKVCIVVRTTNIFWRKNIRERNGPLLELIHKKIGKGQATNCVTMPSFSEGLALFRLKLSNLMEPFVNPSNAMSALYRKAWSIEVQLENEKYAESLQNLCVPLERSKTFIFLDGYPIESKCC